LAWHAFRRPRVGVLVLIAALAVAAVLIGVRASGGGTDVAKAKCPAGYVRAEQDLAERWERSKERKAVDREEAEREREREASGSGIEHSSKYCMRINRDAAELR
jgi:hypothetical protein